MTGRDKCGKTAWTKRDKTDGNPDSSVQQASLWRAPAISAPEERKNSYFC
jgi:hypothetical protein